MPKLNNLTKFLLGFLAVYIFISALHFTSPVRKAHLAIFTTSEQLVFNIFHPSVWTNFKTYEKPIGTGNELFDFSIFIYTKNQWRKFRANPSTPPNVQVNQSAKLSSIGPFTLFLALLLVTPITWKRKLFALFMGSFLILVFIALKYSYMFQENDTMFALSPYSIWGILTNAFGNAFRTHEFMLLCVLGAWAMVSLRLKDYKWFIK